MKLLIITRDDLALEFRLPHEIITPDSPRGQQIVQLYGVTQYPAWVVTRSDGLLVQIWQGSAPSEAELSYYLNRPL